MNPRVLIEFVHSKMAISWRGTLHGDGSLFSEAALRKRCSENMQQIYRRTPMLKCDFNKAGKQLLQYFYHGIFLLNVSQSPSIFLRLKLVSSILKSDFARVKS